MHRSNPWLQTSVIKAVLNYFFCLPLLLADVLQLLLMELQLCCFKLCLLFLHHQTAEI